MLGDSLTVLLIGFGVVFVGLLSLIGIIYLMSFIVRLIRREEVPRKKESFSEIIPQHTIKYSANNFINDAPALTGEKRRETVAAVSAAIAEYLGTDASGFRIHSIKRVGESGASRSDRRELVAVISAAIASRLDTDVTGIRIHSIKKVS